MSYSRNSIRRVITLVLVFASLLNVPLWPGPSTGAVPTFDASIAASGSAPILVADPQTKAAVSKSFGKLPLTFEANAGQVDPKVQFISRGPGYSLFLTPTEAVLALRAAEPRPEGKKSQSRDLKSAIRNPQSVVRMKLTGAQPAPVAAGLDALPGKSHYLIGNDQSQWRQNVTNYARVRYQNVYPGIDMIYYGNQQQLEYDFVVAPGADPNAIKLRFDGIKKMRIDHEGDLILQTANGEVRQRKPVIYQEVNGHREEIAGRYLLTGKRQVSFELGGYDRTRPLVIDPVLAYSTYLGGSNSDSGSGIAVDKEGNAYVVGSTISLDFPVVNAFQPNFGGFDGSSFTPNDAFITKLNRDGSALIFSTYLGGKSSEGASGVAVDRDGNVYVAGSTFSKDFPTKNAIQPAASPGSPLGPTNDAFVTKLTADGSALVFSTYLGGFNWDNVTGITIDPARNVYIAGYTLSRDFPTKNPLQSTHGGGLYDAFVTKIKADGSELIYSTYLGGSGDEYLYGIAADIFGNAYVAGNTFSTDFPTANALQPANAGGSFVSDAFATKLNPQGTAFIYSTYLGGSGADIASGIAVDLAGNAYLTGSTSSTDFPTANPYQPALAGDDDAFVTKLNRTGSALCYSTYLGGTDSEAGSGIAVDLRGRTYITGITLSTDYPIVNALGPKPNGTAETRDAMVTVLNARGSGLVYSTYLGGSGVELGNSIAVDALGNAYITGVTTSNDFPVTPGAFQTFLKGPAGPFFNGDAFVSKIGNRLGHHANSDEDEDFLQRTGCQCTDPHK